MDEDHLQNFVERGRKEIAKSGLILGEWLGAGGMGTVYELKKFPGERIVKFSAHGDEAEFGQWIMALRGKPASLHCFAGVGEPRAPGKNLPSFLPAVYSVRLFAPGELAKNDPIWAIEREDLPASIYTQLTTGQNVDPHLGFMETLADKAYELPTDEFRLWLKSAIARRRKIVPVRDRKTWLALGEVMTAFAANGVVLNDVDLDNWAARHPDGEPVLRDLGFASAPVEPYFTSEPHKGGVERGTIREDAYDEYEHDE